MASERVASVDMERGEVRLGGVTYRVVAEGNTHGVYADGEELGGFRRVGAGTFCACVEGTEPGERMDALRAIAAAWFAKETGDV